MVESGLLHPWATGRFRSPMAAIVHTSPSSPSSTPVALVTGGAVRVGRVLSLGLARQGFDLVVNYNSSDAEARHLAGKVEKLGRRCVLARADLADTAGVQSVIDAVDREFGRLDVLVNNASIFGKGSLLELEEAEWDRVMAVNLKVPFLLVKGLAALLKPHEGSVVNIVDLSAFEPWSDYPHHSVSKAGLLHLTRVMARALRPSIRVNAIAPGTVLPPENYPEKKRQSEIADTLVGHLGSPEDVLNALLFLIRSPFVNGEVVVVDGGMRWGR